MFDGSAMSYEDNVKNTKLAVEMAKKYGANVEAEIGVLAGTEAGGTVRTKDSCTDPLLAQKFVEETKIDALAASFGTVHGFYQAEPKLDFERINKISTLCKIPIVMHGGSGISKEDYIKAIDNGVRKINYYSYMSKAGTDAVKRYIEEHSDVAYYHDIANAAIDAMKENLYQTIKIFSNS